jgi:hypothetical protein
MADAVEVVETLAGKRLPQEHAMKKKTKIDHQQINIEVRERLSSTPDDKGEGDGRTARLDLYTSSWRNWDFDLQQALEHNADTMDSI